MQKSTSGFTIVELLVVCIVMAIIATIGTMAFIGYQNQSRASQGAAMANIIKAGAEKYFNDNGEYPNATQLSSLSASANVLGTSKDALTTSNFTFCVYSTTGCSSTDVKKLYYIARDTNANSTLDATFNDCKVTLSAPNSPETNGPTAYATAFYSPETNAWVVQKGNHGNVGTSAGCQAS
jgi:prepilin-type N-terminal cleavage/methylation domain-containing protein